ncbi:MAG: GntR family transcriptional regulator [Gammaproteobacteria bacterium]|nr:GntR family transcriptional regulator [Gammaproteobacteria bacterium]
MEAVSNRADVNGRSPARTLTDAVYRRLRNDIIHGRLEPGSKLRIEALRQQYEVGATPLREALSRLTSEGFVTSEGQRGFRVTEVSMADLMDITNMRITLEGMALAQSMIKGDDAWESNVVAAFHRLTKVELAPEPDLIDWEARNAEFHLALISACTSSWLRRFYDVLYDQHKRYRNMARLAHNVPRDIHGEHIAIKEAALKRDAKAALAANEQHIRRTAEVCAPALAEIMAKRANA